MIHQLIKESVECLYCHGTKKKKWFSEWNCEHHYKTFICPECGKKNHVCVSFLGDGNDDFGELEKRVA